MGGISFRNRAGIDFFGASEDEADTDGTLNLGSEPFKPETAGEFIEIRVTGVRPVTTKDGKPGVVVEGIDKDGRQRDWVAWNLHNKGELRRKQALPGDMLRITYDGRDPNADNEALAARLFTLEKLEQATAADAEA